MSDREPMPGSGSQGAPAGGLIAERGTGLALAVVEPSELLRDLLVEQIAACLPEARIVAVSGVGELSQAGPETAARRCILLAAEGDGDAMRDVVATALRAWPAARVVALPETATPDGAAAVMHAGGHGVIPKSYSRQSFTAALAVVLSGACFVPWTLQAANATSKPEGVALTARERRVLACLGDGMSNREIAGILNLREVTVKLHVRALFRKLGVNNRTKAVRQAIRWGILD